ncbi:Hypothetical protein, putative [Bodo saltans]|uniref:Zinc finger protein n=1 Tax=Bodo saltans TaxID=75058 RepID=A0A0S4ILJ0_BODSA|nr:Hypothetical protein, putative [Bodo saltans]|eukprot:CUE71458.1 Hypothetical protein, putative [Bodo saltans]
MVVGEKRPREGNAASSSSERRRGGGNRSGRRRGPKPPPPCPPGFKCHQCEQNHWTKDCPRVMRDPHRYPKIDVVRGCYQCGQVGHNPAACPVKREKCHECGGMHNTLHCPFKHPPQEWHEFFSPKEQHVYYYNSETKQVTWDEPLTTYDTVLWHCDGCKLLIPNDVKECVECHVLRPVTVVEEVVVEESEGDDDDVGEDDDEYSVNQSGDASGTE